MLSAEQLEEFERVGLVRVDGLLDRRATESVQDALWSFLADRDGVVRDDPTTWPDGPVRKLGPLRKAGHLDAFDGPEMVPFVEQLLGADQRNTDLDHGVQALVTFPVAGPWALPHKIWHFDLPARGPTDRITTLRVLGLFGDVEARGGATLVVEGSHELVRRMVEASPEHDVGQSADVRKALQRQHEWFAELGRPGDDRIGRLMDETSVVDGVEVRVTELTGDAGDVWLMHPWTLHNLSPNVADRPRLMTSHSVYGRDQLFF